MTFIIIGILPRYLYYTGKYYNFKFKILCQQEVTQGVEAGVCSFSVYEAVILAGSQNRPNPRRPARMLAENEKNKNISFHPSSYPILLPRIETNITSRY
jgi:hypothetical protein